MVSIDRLPAKPTHRLPCSWEVNMASPTSRTLLDARTPLGTGKAGPHTTLIRKPVLPSHHFYFILSQNKILCPYFCWAEFNSHASNQAASKVENN